MAYGTGGRTGSSSSVVFARGLGRHVWGTVDGNAAATGLSRRVLLGLTGMFQVPEAESAVVSTWGS
jgi:hypothetical protein